jgi:hypothetical protein
MVAGPETGARLSLRRGGGRLGFGVNHRSVRRFHDGPMTEMRDLSVRLAVVVGGRLNVDGFVCFDGGRRILSQRGRAEADQCDYAQ